MTDRLDTDDYSEIGKNYQWDFDERDKAQEEEEKAVDNELEELLEEPTEVLENDRAETELVEEIEAEIEEEIEEEIEADLANGEIDAVEAEEELEEELDELDEELEDLEHNLGEASEALTEALVTPEEPSGSPTGETEEVVTTGTRSFILRVATPGNDIFTASPTDDILIGRTGSDRLLGVDPGADNPGQGELDILIGGPSQPVEMFEGEGSTVAPDNNTFLLGDASNAYYTAEGFNDFALLLDFDASKDTIVLNGEADDYSLSEINTRFFSVTLIFQEQPEETTDELVALLLPGTSGLTLDDDSFEFVDTPPSQEPAIPSIEQLGTPAIDLSWGVSVDSAGNIYAVGGTSGSLEGTNAGANDAWLAKFNSDGDLQFIEQFGTPLPETAFSTAVDSNDNVFVSGITSGDLGGPNAGGVGNDVWLAKFDNEGNQQFITQFGTPTPVDNAFWGTLAIDNEDNVLLTGYTEGDLGATNAGTADIWLAKFDNDGNQQFIEQFGTSEPDESFGVAIDTENNILITGWTLGDLEGSNAGLFDAWVAKFDSEGDRQWLDQFGTSDYDFAWDVAVDSEGNVYTTGYSLGDLGGSNAGAYDVFVGKYDPDGNRQWLELYGSSGSEEALEIEVDNDDNLLLTGFTNSTFGGSSAGEDDVWTAKLASDNGNILDIVQFGSSEDDRNLGLALNSTDVFQSGFTDGSLGDSNVGSYDAWVAQLSLSDLSVS